MAGNPFEEFVQTELPKRPYLPADVQPETILVRRGPGPRQMDAVTLQEGEVLGLVDGVLKGIVPNTGPSIDAVTHVQSFTSATWSITHNRNNDNVQVTLYDIAGAQFEPDTITIARNTVTIRMAEPVMGRAVLIFAPQTEAAVFEPNEEVEDISEVVTEPVTVENQPAPVQATKPNNTLLNGSGNPNGGFTEVSNGHLNTLLSARIRRVATLPEPVEGHYTLELGATRSWTFVHSLALLSTDYGSVLTNFYNVTVRVQDVAHEAEGINLTLTRVGDAYRNIDEANNIRIIDGTYTADLSVYQDIQSPSFYLDAFPSSARNAENGLIGEFRITLTATPKADVAGSVVVNTITITANGVAV